MSIDRYAAWLARHDIAHVVHPNWIELPDLGMGVVVTLTPPLSRNATIGACRRVAARSACSSSRQAARSANGSAAATKATSRSASWRGCTTAGAWCCAECPKTGPARATFYQQSHLRRIMDYQSFLTDKLTFSAFYGHEVADDDIHTTLYPHQRSIVRWAVHGGRRAIFARFGLGKSVMQLETLRLTIAHAGGRALVICPLGVRQEFRRDAERLGLTLTFVRRSEEVDASDDRIFITNYESVRDGKLDPNLFTAVSLDEASVLRSFGSKTYQEFLTLFASVPYRFVATATPSPNRYKELIHYAGYLGVMDTGQALTRWFKRDSTKANNLTLHSHKADEFWLWLSTWAAFVQQPSDLGYSDDGYTLPPMQVHRHEVYVDHSTGGHVENDGSVRMFRGDSMSMVEASREKQRTLDLRIAEMMAIIGQYRDDGDLDQIVLWCDLNVEQDAIERALTAVGISWSSIHGSLDVDEAESRMAQWRNRETVALIGKPVMLGQGVNLQQCNKAVFVGITYNDLIQATHRLQRYGQTRTVQTHIIHADSERNVWVTLMEKWEQHKELTTTMSELIREHGLSSISVDQTLKRSIGVERQEASGDLWMHVHNDTARPLLVADGLPDAEPAARPAPRSSVCRAREGSHPVRQPVRHRFTYRVAAARSGDRPLPPARLRLLRHDHRRHRRGAREQSDVPAHLWRDA